MTTELKGIPARERRAKRDPAEWIVTYVGLTALLTTVVLLLGFLTVLLWMLGEDIGLPYLFVIGESTLVAGALLGLGMDQPVLSLVGLFVWLAPPAIALHRNREARTFPFLITLRWYLAFSVSTYILYGIISSFPLHDAL